MAQKDYYKILGISETASSDEIKKAYRKLAKKYHPDATGGDKAKEARFKEISEAYETLGDSKKRAAYDEIRKNPFAGMPGGGYAGRGGFAGGPGGIGIDLEDLLGRVGRGGGRVHVETGGGGGGFADMFGDLFGGMGGGRARAEPRRGQDIVARLDIDLPEAAVGAEKTITVDGKRLTVKIPPGVTDGKTIRLAGQGHAGARGAPAGDLLIELHERPHPTFRRRAPGSPDIETNVHVPVDVAILGGKADVRTLEGTTISLTIPPGTTGGQKLRVRGKGAYVSKTQRGDLYADVAIQIPQNVPPRARELLEEFARAVRKHAPA